MSIGGENVNVVDGEILQITKVSRLHMAAYLCVASNGVPPSSESKDTNFLNFFSIFLKYLNFIC